MKKTQFVLENGTVLCTAEVADNPLTRMRGLLGRGGLAADEGLFIKPCSSVHCFFMRFTIDVVYLDRDLRIVKQTTVPPWRISSGGRGAKHVIELAAGRAASVGARVGEQLTLRALAPATS